MRASTPRQSAATGSGAAAVAQLGAQLPSVARRHGWSAEQLKSALLADPSLHVDSTDRLYYVEPPARPLSNTADGAVLADGRMSADGAAADTPSGAAPYALSDTFKLHSLPGAKLTIFLDFGGRTMTGNAWTASDNSGQPIVCPPFSIDADPAFSDAEKALIQEVWQRVAEDYAPFNVDVTTELTSEAAITRSSSADTVYGTRVLISPISSSIAPTAGGIAYVGVFDMVGDYYKPALVFSDKMSNMPKYIAEAAAHECGHNLGLSHDGTSVLGYYAGSGSGETGWAPIMGVGYYQNLSQWSEGEYPDANNQQDDLAILAGYLGYRADDVGDTTATAQVLPVSATLSASGIISSSADVDVFRFAVGDGPATIDVKPATVGPDIDVSAELRDSSGNLVAASNPVTSLSAHLAPSLSHGTYYLYVRGTGKGSPLDVGGYSSYASIGQYSVTGSVIAGTQLGPYWITVAPSSNGTITPPGVQTVAWGASKSFSVTPAASYHVVDVKEDGVSIGASSSVTLRNVVADHTLSAAFEADALGSVLRPVYRFRNLKSGFYLWSADENEKATIIRALSETWICEGVAYRIDTTNPLNDVPLWRFVSAKGGFYLYSADPSEKASLIANLSGTWRFEGQAFRVTTDPSGSPVWRFLNVKNGTYLYTGDPAEKNTIVSTLTSTWKLEGIAYYLAP